MDGDDDGEKCGVKRHTTCGTTVRFFGYIISGKEDGGNDNDRSDQGDHIARRVISLIETVHLTRGQREEQSHGASKA